MTEWYQKASDTSNSTVSGSAPGRPMSVPAHALQLLPQDPRSASESERCHDPVRAVVLAERGRGASDSVDPGGSRSRAAVPGGLVQPRRSRRLQAP